MTTGVLERGTATPPGRLVFVPVDGRAIVVPPRSLYDGLRAPVRPLDMWVQDFPRGADWVLVACLVALRAEFNRLNPNRDKASDGSIGDTAHAASSSDHNGDESGATPYEDSDNINEVHAIDVDATGPWPRGLTMQIIVNHIAAEHRAGRDDRLQNIIYMGRIISRSWGWDSWHTYSGANPHDKHAHFSARYTTGQENDTTSWGVATLGEADDLVTSQTEFNTFMTGALRVPAIRMELGEAMLEAAYGSTARPGRTVATLDRDLHHLRDVLAGDALGAAAIKLPAGAPVLQLIALPGAVSALAQVVAKIAENVAADDADLPQLLAAIEATRLGNPSQSVDQIVTALRALLGDRAGEVGAALAEAGEPGQ